MSLFDMSTKFKQGYTPVKAKNIDDYLQDVVIGGFFDYVRQFSIDLSPVTLINQVPMDITFAAIFRNTALPLRLIDLIDLIDIDQTDFKIISLNPAVTPEFIEQMGSKGYDWYQSGVPYANSNISWEYSLRNPAIYESHSCMAQLSAHPSVTIDIINAHPNLQWVMSKVAINPNITIDIVKSNKHLRWPMTDLANNKNITWNILNQLVHDELVYFGDDNAGDTPEGIPPENIVLLMENIMRGRYDDESPVFSGLALNSAFGQSGNPNITMEFIHKTPGFRPTNIDVNYNPSITLADIMERPTFCLDKFRAFEFNHGVGIPPAQLMKYAELISDYLPHVFCSNPQVFPWNDKKHIVNRDYMIRFLWSYNRIYENPMIPDLAMIVSAYVI